MAAINELISRIEDTELRASIQSEVNKLTSQKKFGLVFEDHIPECTPLYDVPIRAGSLVAPKSGSVQDLYMVTSVKGEKAICIRQSDKNIVEIDICDLVSVTRFGEPIYPYLKPIDTVCRAPDSDLWHTLIEADNYRALQLLEYLYAGKVDCIYIDPPYNTGNDFVYADDFADPLARYKEVTAQTTKSNPETMGRFQTNWLNMMYPRLRLAANLLRDDGVIFISADENEITNLRKLSDEIFGEENFIIQIIWKKRSTPPNDKVIGAAHEYVVGYAKSLNSAGLNLRERRQEQLSRYQNPDNHPKGPWTAGDLGANVKGGRYVASLYYPIVNPNTGEEHYPPPNGNWRFSKDTIERLLANNEIYSGEDGKGRPKLKRFLRDVKDGITYASLWDFVPCKTQGSKEMTEILGNISIFDNPKPVDLIKEACKLGSDKDTIILDVMLKLGVSLDFPVNPVSINGKAADSVGEDCLLLVCLAPDVQPEDVEQMAEYAPAKAVISRGSFADDTAMSNAFYILRDRGVELNLV